MSVLLLNPPYRPTAPYVSENVDPPTNVALVAATARRRGHAVDLYDMAPFESAWDDLPKVVRAHAPLVVGIHNHSVSSLHIAGRLAERVRQARPEAVIVAGGPNASYMPERFLRLYPALDAVVVGEGETTFPDLVDAVAGGRGLEGIPGVVFRRDGKVIANPARPVMPSLDDNPLPALDLVPLATYVNRGERYIIETIRGCKFKCQFCASALPGSFGHERFRPIDHVMVELEAAVKGYGFKRVFFVDNCFTSDRARAVALCQAIIDSGLKLQWMAMARVDSVDPDLLRLMKEAGCWVLGFGVESATQSVLNSINKRAEVGAVHDAFRWTREAGIISQAFIILGLPEDTRQGLHANLRLLSECRPDEVGTHALIPLPGTPYFEHPERYGLEIIDDLDRYGLFDVPKAATKYLSRNDIIEYVLLYNYMYRDNQPFDLESPKPRRKRDIPYIAHEGGGIFYNPYLTAEERVPDVYRCSFALDEVAFEVFMCCDGYHTVPQMVDRVVRLYGLARDEAGRRVTELLGDFTAVHILEFDGPALEEARLSGLPPAGGERG